MPNLCQSDRFFLAFSDITRNERHTVSIIKIRVNKLLPCFGGRGSEVRILLPRPFKTIGYGLGRSPLLSLFFLAVEIF